MTIHPKTSAAALGGALGVVICGVLHSIHGLTIAPELYAAVPTLLSTLGAFLAPSPPGAPPPAPAAPPAPAPAQAPPPAA